MRRTVTDDSTPALWMCLAIVVIVIAVGLSAQPSYACSPEDLFRTLGGVSLGAVELRPIRITSVAVDSWDSGPEGIKYFVRLRLNGEIVLHGTSDSSSPHLKGRFHGSLVGTVLTDKTTNAIIRIDIAKTDLNLVVDPAAGFVYVPLGHEGALTSGFRITNPGPVSLGEALGGSGLLLVRSLHPVRLVGGRPFGPNQPSVTASSAAPLTADFDLSARSLAWRPADFRLESGDVALVLDTPTFHITGNNAQFDQGVIHVERNKITASLDDVVVRAPSVTLRNGDPLPIDAVGDASLGRLSASSTDGGLVTFELPGPNNITLRPDRERIVDLVNDYKREPNRYVPTGNVTVPLISTYALREFQTALQNSALVPDARHEILLAINKSRAISEAHEVVADADNHSTLSKIVCTTFVWGTDFVIDAGEIAALARSLVPLGLAVGLEVGALTIPVLAGPVFGAVVAVGAVGGWAATTYWGGVIDDEFGPGAAHGYKPKDVYRSLLDKGLEKTCQVGIALLEGDSKAPRSDAQLAALPSRNSGETDKATRDRWETSLRDATNHWSSLPRAQREAIRGRFACCDRSDFQRAFARDAEIWSTHATARVAEIQQEFKTQDDARIQSWVSQQRGNIAASNQEEIAVAQLRAWAEASLQQSIGGYNLILDYSPSSGWSVPGMSTGLGNGGTGQSGCGSCCALNCLSLEVKRP